MNRKNAQSTLSSLFNKENWGPLGRGAATRKLVYLKFPFHAVSFEVVW